MLRCRCECECVWVIRREREEGEGEGGERVRRGRQSGRQTRQARKSEKGNIIIIITGNRARAEGNSNINMRITGGDCE